MPDELPVLAIDGGAPSRPSPWPEPPTPEPAADDDPVRGAEEALAAYLGLGPSLVVSYGTQSEAYRAALGVAQPTVDRDEIVVPALLAEAAAEAAREAGWRIVPADLEADTGAISSRGLVRAISERTAGIVVVHAFGHPAVMSDILRVAEDRSLAVIEDIAGSLGAAFRGAPAGRMGQAAVLLGRPGDPVTRGAFTIFAEESAASATRSNRSAPLAEDDARGVLAELRSLEDELTQRRRLAWELTFNMRGMKAVAPMPHGRWIHHAYPVYVVRIRGILWKRSLEDTVAAIRAEGVACEVACGQPLQLDPAGAAALPDATRVGDDAFTVANRLPQELIAIPLHSNLTSKDMDQVAAALRKVEGRSI